MESEMNQIVTNARSGQLHCSGCKAHEAGNSEYVNPGLSNWDCEVMVVTDEPKHPVNWDSEESWADWNKKFMSTYPSKDGGKLINYLLEPLPINIYDVWIADTVKCPTETADSIDTVDIPTEKVFEKCHPYLDREVQELNPAMIIALGNNGAERTGYVMDETVDAASISRPGEIFDTDPPIVVSPHWGAKVYYSSKYPDAKEAAQSAIEKLYHEVI